MTKVFFRSLAFCLIGVPNVFCGQGTASVPEPFVYTPECIERAKENAARYAWAQAELDQIMARADEAASQTPETLRGWFYKTTPTNQCSCPHCGAYWLNYIWDWSPDKPDQLTCNYCHTEIGVGTYPENALINRTDPQGNRIPHPVYKDEKGQIFPIRQAIAYFKAQHAYDWIEALGAAYALTGEEKYADTAGQLLERLATTYPSYAWHDNFRFESKAWGWAGKLSGWHMHDAMIFIQLAKTYDSIRRSDSLTPEQRHHIEEDLFRLGGKMLTAVHPLQGISNDGAYRYGGVAIIGRLLQDHEILSWVMNERNGYAVFVDKLFYEDGAWHERTPSYHNMLCNSLYLAPYFLDGYSDPEEYTGDSPYRNIQLREITKLKTIHALPFRMRLPDGSLPPVNDSRWGTKPTPDGSEALYAFTGEEQWLAYLQEAYEGKVLETGSAFALFNRPVDLPARLASMQATAPIPEVSEDFTGVGLFMLRRGTGENRTVFTLHHHKIANSHSHYDAMSTILFAEGREMLSDIGYPLFGIRERTTWYTASLSHNTLTVDTLNQRAPNGVANFLHHGELFSACEGESWDSYRFICEPFTRQIALIDTDSGRPYAVDVFRGGGGNTHDFALHGEGSSLEVDRVSLSPEERFEGKDYAYEEVSDVMRGETSEPWDAAWRWDDGAILDVHLAAQENCEVFTTRSPGQRLREQRGRKINSLFVRRKGEDLRSEFVAVYDPNRGQPVVKSIEKMLVSPETDWAVVLKVELENATDYILTSYTDISPLGNSFTDGAISIPWESRFGVVRVKDGKIVHSEWVHDAMEGLTHDI